MALGQCDKILRAFGAGYCRHDRAHVQMQSVGINWRIVFIAPKAIFLCIGFHQGNAILIAAGGMQIADGFVVDWEKAAGGTVFWGHIGDGCAIREGQIVEARAVKFDEFTHNTACAQHFDHFENQICARCAFHHSTGQLKADDFRDQHRDRLTEHGGFRLDAANSPTQHRSAVDHSGVTVCADQSIRISNFLTGLVLVGPNCLG